MLAHYFHTLQIKKQKLEEIKQLAQGRAGKWIQPWLSLYDLCFHPQLQVTPALP